MEKGTERAVDVALLPAGEAIIAGKEGAAIEAGGFLGVAVSVDGAGYRLDRSGNHPAHDDRAHAFDLTHCIPLRPSYPAMVARVEGGW